MENTWASGALELLRHADSHIELESAFDKRIAFISIDNSVETSVRVFLSMPESKSGVKVTRKEYNEVEGSFPKMVALLFDRAGGRLAGIDDGDIEHYHRIRNTLYHNGTGLSVDDQYLHAYRSIAQILLQNLFGVAPVATAPETPPPTLDTLIRNWNQIDRIIRDRLAAAGIEVRHMYKLDTVQNAGIITHEQLVQLVDLRSARNKLVHSTEIDKAELSLWAVKSQELLDELKA